MIVEAAELLKFQFDAYAFLLAVDVMYSSLKSKLKFGKLG